jgi:hypothetical protein
VRRVCSELIMWYRKLTILDRISKRHSRPLDFPLGASRLPSRASRAPRTSLSRASRLPSRASRAPRDFPLARLATSLSRASRLPSRAPRDSSGTFKSRLEKRVGARGARLAHPTGTLAFGEAPSPGPTRRREAPCAPPTRAPRHYRARATSCGVPSYWPPKTIERQQTNAKERAASNWENGGRQLARCNAPAQMQMRARLMRACDTNYKPWRGGSRLVGCDFTQGNTVHARVEGQRACC